MTEVDFIRHKYRNYTILTSNAEIQKGGKELPIKARQLRNRKNNKTYTAELEPGNDTTMYLD